MVEWIAIFLLGTASCTLLWVVNKLINTVYEMADRLNDLIAFTDKHEMAIYMLAKEIGSESVGPIDAEKTH